MLSSSLTTAKRTETVDPLLDSAVYSYSSRLSSPYYALRTTLLVVELLSLKGGTIPDDAVKWAIRALATGTLDDFTHSILIHRIVTCYKQMYPRRKRKMALWSMIACENWVSLDCKGFALGCLKDAMGVYKECADFGHIQRHLKGLVDHLDVPNGVATEKATEVVDLQDTATEGPITVSFA
jgi:trafficking protein particle complex subunit 8